MRILLSVAAIATLCAPFLAGADNVDPVSGPPANGTIISCEDAFPYATFEEWFDHSRREMQFDEARMRAQVPPEKFPEYRDANHIPATFSYEEWLDQLRRRSAMMEKKWPQIEAEARRNFPPEQIRQFRESIKCNKFLYISDGLKIEGFMLRPSGEAGAALPVIIYNHGGNPRIGSIDELALLRLEWLAREGFVVIASQYRGCGRSEGHDEIGGADVMDVLNLIPVIDNLPGVQREHIGMFGWSRGGIMTYRALTKTNRISAAVVGAGPTDLGAEIARRPAMASMLERNVSNYRESPEQVLHARSAQDWAGTLCKTTPILILQAGDDNNTVPKSALEFALKLQETRHPFRLIFFEDGGHGLAKHTTEVNRQIATWFNRYLKKAPGSVQKSSFIKTAAEKP